MLEIITTKNKWDSFLFEFDMYDTYHTFDYHMVTKFENETPIFIKYIENDVVIGLPLLIRPISGSNYKDATSVYGYCGPLSNGIHETFDNTRFVEALINYFNETKLISIFSRLNPYIKKQENILLNLGNILPLGKVVNINLNLDEVIQRQNYHRRLKNHINKSRRSCDVIKATSHDQINTFIKIYNENMLRVNARKEYFFSKEYFLKLFKSEDFKTEILLALDKDTNQIISGAMFFKKNAIVQYHLSGTKNEFLHLMPTKLLIDEMRINSASSGYKFFNLGGGLGVNNEDSLFKFKSSFSDDFQTFSLWKFIVNKKVYDEICKKSEIKNTESNYFPLYRLKEHV